jgi:hypothetical protein
VDYLAPEVLLAVLTAAVGIYVLLPEHRRLRFQLRMHLLDWVVLISSVAMVHYILFLPVVESLGLAFDLGPWRWGFTPALASYAILGGAVAFVAVRTGRSRLARRRIGAFGRLMDELRYEDRYAELFFVLEGSLSDLRKAYHGDYLLVKLRRRWSPTDSEVYLSALRGESPSPPPAFVRKLARILPSYEATADQARDVVRRLLLTESFAERVATTKPYVGLTVLNQPFVERSDFQDLWFRALLDDTRSVLYFEISNNDNLSGLHRYYIRPENKIISFFFGDCEVAEHMAVYRSFGNYAQQDLDRRWAESTDRYNQPFGGFAEEEASKSALYASLRLFDIMVSESFYQGIRWHMWLYYLPGLADRILRNMDPVPQVDLTLEWPTPYHFFLYEAVSMLRHWVEIVEAAPKEQENAVLSAVDVRHDNANIPKSAALALGSIIGKVLEDSRLNWRFKEYLFEIGLRSARDLLEKGIRPEYGRLLLLSLARSGVRSKNERTYLELADRAFEGADHVLRFRLEDEWRPLVS